LRLPAAPPDFTAERRGDEVKLQFTAPSANTDGSRPADIDRVEVYGYTGPFTVNDEHLLKYGSKVATVTVRAPKNPDVTTEPEEPPEEPELKEEGIDQGAVAQLVEPLTAAASNPDPLPKSTKDRRRQDDTEVDGPLLSPRSELPWRIFVAVGINTKGRRGPPSKRITVPLVTPPAPPSDASITYDEKTITVTWKPSPSWAPVQPSPQGDVLPAVYFGIDVAKLEYHVYDVSPAGATAEGSAGAAQAPLEGEVRLTNRAVEETSYTDTRMEWGKTRCYGVRAFETVAGQTLESVSSSPVCVTLKDTFPPEVPKNLQHIASEGVISLIWEPNAEADLAGYLVLRGRPPGNAMEPLTPDPITATVFEDKVPSGMRYTYAVVAVDRAGNRSPQTPLVEDAAR
jgi:hypothetical protein